MTLRDRIADRTCRYGVIGMGYVGLPLMLRFAQSGVRVTGFEVDDAKVESIQAGRSYIPDVDDGELAREVEAGRIDATLDMSRLADMDVISICVPTPLSKSRDPDLSYVESALRSVESALRPGQLIVLESTTYPGMTEEMLLPRLATTGLRVGSDFWLAFSPERVDPANPRFGVRNTPKVVGGVDEASTEMAAAFYRMGIEHVHPVSSASAAEMVKLLENTFRSVNIGLVNEVALMCDRLGLDASEVIRAAATKPFGFMRFEPGPGIGGHCIPLDPIYLSWKLRHLDYRARFVELAQDVNTAMPQYVAERVASALNERARSVKGSRILVVGVAYKPDVDDTRESPALEVIRLLVERGAEVSFADPHVETISAGGALLERTELSQNSLAAADCVVVTTHHSDIDWEAVGLYAHLIVDTRGAVPKESVTGTLLTLSGPAYDGAKSVAPLVMEAAR
ncbi:MAG: nucleotide sugar dehydrogenase [Planctomycetota bacterium]|nr:nucleotide sugar dehydrogenase [Planctomycetota bacterium]